MKSQKIILIALVVIAIGALVGVAALQLSPWQAIRTVIPDMQNRSHLREDLPLPVPMSLIGAFLTIYVSGIFLMYLFPGRVQLISRAFLAAPRSLLRMFVLGLLTFLVIITATIGSVFSMGTFGLTFFLVGVLFFSILFGNVALSYRLGQYLILNAGWERTSPLVSLVLGDLTSICSS